MGMVVVGEIISDGKMKVCGLYREGTVTDTVTADIHPDPVYTPGKDSVLYLNTETKELYYEYIDRPLTESERVQELEKQLEVMQKALDDVALGGA